LELDIKNAATKMGYLLEFTAFIADNHHDICPPNPPPYPTTTVRQDDNPITMGFSTQYLHQ
jgi:hypothetical protein